MGIDYYVQKLHTEVDYNWYIWEKYIKQSIGHKDVLNSSVISAGELEFFAKHAAECFATPIKFSDGLDALSEVFDKLIAFRNRFTHVLLNPGNEVHFVHGTPPRNYNTHDGYFVWHSLMEYIAYCYYFIAADYKDNTYDATPKIIAYYEEECAQIRSLFLSIAANIDKTITRSCNIFDVSIYNERNKQQKGL